ncbi:hypothetical protein QHH_02 [Halomonas phage QHHSV-1]|nr:hypothetical protein QHH_02 [Halomonas phage QHHSV-1]
MTALAQPTSNEVKREGLDDVRRSGRSAHQQIRILRSLYWCAEGQGWTRQDLAEGLGIPLSSICGRCSELLDMRFIEPIDTVGKPARQILGITKRGLDYLQLLSLTISAKGATA